MMVEILSQTGSWGGQNSLNVEFGFGNANIVDSLIIEWPSGSVETHTNIAVNQFIIVIEGQGLTNVNEQEGQIVQRFELRQNFPNPFNPSTTISYSVPASGFVILKIYDMLGREVQTLVSELQEPGMYSVFFDARNLPSSIYYYRLKVGNHFVETKKMLLIR